MEIDPDTHTLKREGIESILNPLDTFAVEEALRIRQKIAGKVTVITLGPPQARLALQEAISVGVDDAVLVSDRQFAGSDTWATAVALAAALRKTAPWDIIICGKQAIDGDTAHVGPEIAALLHLPQITFVRNIEAITSKKVVAERMVESGSEFIEAPLPAVLTVVKDLNEPRWPNLRDLYRARFYEPMSFTAADLSLSEQNTGLDGSPTRVVEMSTPENVRNTRMFEDNYREGVLDLIPRLHPQKE